MIFTVIFCYIGVIIDCTLLVGFLSTTPLILFLIPTVLLLT